MSVLKKIQEQPLYVRKIIFWIIVIILAITFLFVWIYSIRIRLEEAKQKNFFDGVNFPKFQEELDSLPKIEPPPVIPELSEEELKQLEEELMKAQEEQPSTPETPQ